MARLLSFPVTRNDLNAFVDGELDGIQTAVVHAALYADRDKFEEVAAYRAQNEGLRALYGELEAVPASLQAVIDSFRPVPRMAC